MHFPGSPPIICLAIFVFAIQLCVCKNSTIADDTSKHTFEVGNSVENGEKKKALHTIRKVLENYSDNAIRQILGSTTIIPAHGDELRETTPEDFISTTPPVSPKTITSSKFHDPEKLVNEEEPSSNIKPKAGIMRIRADIRSSSSSAQQNDERPLNRQYRSARNDWLQHHRRRRKGCPPLHGRDQLLCPSRNAHRYDVCISREQLCDHVVDCPGGEDENVEQCFFYKPLDDQLKTLSHAVLLLVDNIMSDSKQKQEL